MTQLPSKPPTTPPPQEAAHGLVANSPSSPAEFKTDPTPIEVGARVPVPGGALVFLGRTGDGQYVFVDAGDFDASPNPERRSRPLIRRRAAPEIDWRSVDGTVDRRRDRRPRWARVS